MKQSANKSGMTIVEILLAVGIIALLTGFIIPAVNMAVRNRENAECSYKLRTAIAAFELYASETGAYPADRTPGVEPPEMENYYFPYFKIDWWSDDTALGGKWDWDNGYNFRLSVSIAAPTKSQDQMEDFDELIDNGDLNSGNFRKVGSQYHYIIEQ
jgi:type II secretory pathway pseudopilin PulG